MSTTLLNNHTKFRAKIFKPYRVITFLVLGHFFSRTLYRAHRAVIFAIARLSCIHRLRCCDHNEYTLGLALK